jgi:hypothetical protein
MSAEKESEAYVRNVGTSEVHEGTEVSFDRMKINFVRMCDGDPKAPIRFSVKSDNTGDRPDLLYGSFTSTIESLKSSVGKEIQLVGENNSFGGILVFNTFEQVEKPNFIEYL